MGCLIRANVAVIPAQAGIQKLRKTRCLWHAPDWIPAYAGMTAGFEPCAPDLATFAGQGVIALAF